MTRYLLALALAVVAAAGAAAQVCSGSITIATQAEADAFACTEVERDLLVDSDASDPVVSLAGLSELTRVGRGLSLIGNAQLETLAGLDALSSVGTYLSVIGNDALVDVDALGALTAVGTNLVIRDNAALLNVEGLSSVSAALTGNLTILGNASLANLDGLASIRGAGAALILSNPQLVDLDGLGALADVSGDVRVQSNAALTSLSGLDGLITIGGDFLIKDNTSLLDLDQMGSLESVSGDIELEGNSALASLRGFQALEEIGGGFSIVESGNQMILDGFPMLVSIGGDLALRSSRIERIGGFDSLEAIGGSLTLNNVYELTTIDDFSSLRAVGGNLILLNTDIILLRAFASLEEVGGRLDVERNSRLRYVDSFVSLVRVIGRISIYNNRSLDHVGDFPSLVRSRIVYISLNRLFYVGDFPNVKNTPFDIYFNDYYANRVDGDGPREVAQQDLTGARASGTAPSVDIRLNGRLESVGMLGQPNTLGNVRIVANKKLESVAGLDSVSTVSGDVALYFVPLMPQTGWMPALTDVGGNLELTLTPFETLDAFGGLRSIGGSLFIDFNEAIQNVDGLSGLLSVGSDLAVTRNSALSDCSCGFGRFLQDGVDRDVVISENAEGCNSPEEVLQAACPLDTPSYRVTQPISGDYFVHGAPVMVRWDTADHAPAGNVRLSLVCDGQDPYVVRSSAANDGDWGFILPAAVGIHGGPDDPAGGCRAEVAAVSDPSFSSTSAVFVIQNLDRHVSVTEPARSATYGPGSPFTFRWDASAIERAAPESTVDLSILCPGRADYVAFANRPNNGARGFLLPPDFGAYTGCHAQVASSDAAVNGVYGRSAPFEIKDQAAPSVTVTQPSFSPTWQAGTAHTIEWRVTPENSGAGIAIVLDRPDGSPSTRLADIEGVESFRWVIPTDLPPGSGYRIRLIGEAFGQFVRDVSEPFTVSAPSDALVASDQTSPEAPSSARAGKEAPPASLTVEPVAPNPASARVRVRVGLPEAGWARVEVYDVQGRVVATLADGEQEAGWLGLDLSTGSLAAGIYAVRVQTGAETALRTLTVVR